ncbi:glycosyltransferase family protein [Anthocerotibacter panamensis]|uniref:hypothetical protein n=1 Tax=Anthocerotibacter panamensis TaxID=2857077 RepID=UPI001C406AA7|nr:hypothetical protein [Anthocerotibacter panamensis]
MDAHTEHTDLLIVSNGPGELTTWVRPMVARIHGRYPGWRISIVLAPCNNASGNEVDLAKNLPGVARVLGAESYQRFLFTGQTAQGWDWYRRGVVLFLGGDQGFTALIALRLGYPLVTYAEWQVRYGRWMSRVGLRTPKTYPRYAEDPQKFRVVGDLNIDGVEIQPQALQEICKYLKLREDAPLIGLLPGSKGLKLTLGMPLLLKTAELLEDSHPTARFVLPVAPTVDLEKLARFATQENPNIALMGGVTAHLETRGELNYLVTPRGTAIPLWQRFPAYDVLSLCRVCVTTIGVNTAELAALGIPMVVLIPLNKVEVMKAWDGLPGLIMNIPGIGNFIARYVNPWLISRTGLLAWPNLLAGRAIVPELKRLLTPADVARETVPFLDDDGLHHRTRTALMQTMGARGAADRMLGLVEEALAEVSHKAQ